MAPSYESVRTNLNFSSWLGMPGFYRFYRLFSALVFFFGVWCASLFAETPLLRENDIHRVMGQLFSLHIENKELTPLIIRRCFKLYLEQFDPEKVYLLDREALPFLQMNEDVAASIARRVKQNDYSDFAMLNQTIRKAVLRAKNARDRSGSKWILDVMEGSARGSSFLPAVSYAGTENDLCERQKDKLLRFYLYHKSKSDLSAQERKQKLFDLWDRKMCRMENSYLFCKSDGSAMDFPQAEHMRSLRILKAFAKSLDTHTSFFSPDEAHEIRLSLEKQFEGIGIILFEGVDGVMIADLIKGSPAEQSGKIEVNDLLVEIDGMPLDIVSFEEVLDLLKKDQREVALGFKRIQPNEEPLLFQISLQKRPIVMDGERITTSWEKFGDGIIGKISLYSFYESSDGMSSERDIKEAIKAFRQIGPLNGLILDLRENSGGFLNQAVKVAGLFLSNGIVVASKYGKGEIHYLRNISGHSFFNGPLVILTSKMSASASEIVAQAIQDYGVGIVVGDERTFGKGSIQYQTVTDEKADLFFKVTVGKYYTASGRTTQIEGVRADIVVPTHYAPYHIGERYLEYPLQADRIDPVFVDPLTDLDEGVRNLFQRKYMPHLQRVVSFWKKMLPVLRKKSADRLRENGEFQALVQDQERIRARLEILPANSVGEDLLPDHDLPMKEAVYIIQDMIIIESQNQPVAQAKVVVHK